MIFFQLIIHYHLHMESNYKLLKEETINSTEQPDKIITNNKNNLYTNNERN